MNFFSRKSFTDSAMIHLIIIPKITEAHYPERDKKYSEYFGFIEREVKEAFPYNLRLFLFCVIAILTKNYYLIWLAILGAYYAAADTGF